MEYAILGVVATFFLGSITFAVAIWRGHIDHQKRLTRMETKIDTLLVHNGIDLEDCIKRGGK